MGLKLTQNSTGKSWSSGTDSGGLKLTQDSTGRSWTASGQNPEGEKSKKKSTSKVV